MSGSGEVAAEAGQPGVLPLRPLTAGELLDAGVALLRARAAALAGAGAALAAAEQVVLFPLRRLADLDLRFLPADDRWWQWTLLLVVGFATEAAVIAGLGGVAARGGPRALLGRVAPRPERPARPAAVVSSTAVLAAVATGAAAATALAWPATFFLLMPVTAALWAWLYGAVGLAAPAAVVERRGPGAALGRSFGLAHRGVLRALRLRVSAYLGWAMVRVGWGLGVLALVRLFYTPPDTTGDNLLMAVVFGAVNALAYPMLGALDAVLYLEARMRTEGLDIALRRALSRRVDPAPALATPRAVP